MDLNCLAGAIADPKTLTAQSLATVKSALASSFPNQSSMSEENISSLPKKLQKSLRNSTSALSSSISGALRILASCASALEVISQKVQGEALTITWGRRRHYIIQICLVTAQTVPVVVPDLALEVDKKLCNILPLLKNAQVPIQQALDLVDALKYRIEAYGHHKGWVIPNPNNPLVLTPDPHLNILDHKTYVQLACMCLMHSLRLRSSTETSGSSNPLSHLETAYSSEKSGHLGYWLVHLERTHGMSASRSQFLIAARLLALSNPTPSIVGIIVDWLVSGNASFKDIYSFVLRTPAPCPIPPALTHITQHYDFQTDLAQAILIALTWATGSQSTQQSLLPNDLTEICNWLCQHAPALKSSQAETWSLHLAVLLVQAANATLVTGNSNSHSLPRSERALTLLLNHLRSRHESPNFVAINRLQAAIIIRAGCMFVHSARKLTDVLDLNNPFAPSSKYPFALIHDVVSQLVYHIIAYVDLSHTASRAIFEWLMYLTHLVANSKDTEKIIRNLEISLQVCSRAPKTDSSTGMIVTCLRRVSSIAANHAYSAMDSQDRTSALALTKIATNALEQAFKLNSSNNAEIALKLAFRLELVSTLESGLGNQTESQSCIVRAIKLINEHGTTTDVANVTARYVCHQMAEINKFKGRLSPATDEAVDGCRDGDSVCDNDSLELDQTKTHLPAAYTRLSELVPTHWVFAFEWRSLARLGQGHLAKLVLEMWEQMTPPDQSIARGHLILCKAVDAGHTNGVDMCMEAVNCLKDEKARTAEDPALPYRTSLLAIAYSYLALFCNDLTYLPIAFKLIATAFHENMPVILDDIRWHLRKLESILFSRSLFMQLIQLYQILLVLEKDKDRGFVFTRLAEVYLELGYVGQAGYCLSTGSAYLGPHDRTRWTPVYAMYLIAADKVTKAASIIKDFDESLVVDADQCKESIKGKSKSIDAQLIMSLARIHLLHAQGKGIEALHMAMHTLPIASKSSSPVFQLRVQSILSHLFSDMGIWRDAASYAQRGLRSAAKYENLVIHRYFSALSGMVAIRKRAVDEARKLLSLDIGNIPPFLTSTTTRSSLSSPKNDFFPATPDKLGSSLFQGKSATCDTPIKENVLRLVLLGEVSLLEQQVYQSSMISSKTDGETVAPEIAFVDDAGAHESRARAILDQLQKPSNVGDLFHACGRSSETPRLARLLATSQESTSSSKLQRFALVSTQASVKRLHATILWAKGNKPDAAKMAIRHLQDVVSLQGPARSEFVHDCVFIILDAMKPHLVHASQKSFMMSHTATIIESTISIIDSHDTLHCNLDSRVIDRLKFSLVHLVDTIAQTLGSSHPATIHGMVTMAVYIQTIGIEFGVKELATLDCSTIHLLDQGCHGVTFCRMISILGHQSQHKNTIDHGIDNHGRESIDCEKPDLLTPIREKLFENSLTPRSSIKRTKRSPKTPIEEEMLSLRLDDNLSHSASIQSSAICEQLRDVLPSNWIVCQLTIDVQRNVLYLAARTKMANVLLSLPICRLIKRDRSSATSKVDGSYASVRSMFDRVLTENDSMLKSTYSTREEKQKWWDDRERLDKDIFLVLMKLDQHWLGCFRGLLYAIPHPAFKSFVTTLNKFLAKWSSGPEWTLSIPDMIIHGWLALGSSLMASDLDDMSNFLLSECHRQAIQGATDQQQTGPLFDDMHGFLSKALKKITKEFPSPPSAKHTVLVLDKYVHLFPWESSLSLRGKSVSRSFSLSLLVRQLCHCQPVVRRESVYYVINPDGDLNRSQDTFDPVIRNHSEWSGQVGQSPTESSFLNELARHDIFLYCGHNGGEKLCPPKHILHQPNGPKVVFLMGCSSGKLNAPGDYDPIGLPMYYSSHSLAIVSNLWDVTDIDIDRFTLAAMTKWGMVSPQKDFLPVDTCVDRVKCNSLVHDNARNTGSADHRLQHYPATPKVKKNIENSFSLISPRKSDSNNQKATLTSSVAKSRDACRLKYLVGAAPVVYGIPVNLQDKIFC